MTALSSFSSNKILQTAYRFPYALLAALAACLVFALPSGQNGVFASDAAQDTVFLLSCFAACSVFLAVISEAFRIRFAYQLLLQVLLLAAVWFVSGQVVGVTGQWTLSVAVLLILLGAPAFTKADDHAGWSFMRNLLIGHFASLIVFLILLICIWQILYMGRFAGLLGVSGKFYMSLSAFLAYFYYLTFVPKISAEDSAVQPGRTYVLVVNYILIPGFALALLAQVYAPLFAGPTWLGGGRGHTAQFNSYWSLFSASFFKLMICAALLFCLAIPLQATHVLSRLYRRFYFILAVGLAIAGFFEVLRLNGDFSYKAYAWFAVALSAVFGFIYTGLGRFKPSSAYIPLLAGLGLVVLLAGPFSVERAKLQQETAMLEQAFREIGLLGADNTLTPLPAGQTMPTRVQLNVISNGLRFFSTRQNRLPPYLQKFTGTQWASFMWAGEVMKTLNLGGGSAPADNYSYRSANVTSMNGSVVSTAGYDAITGFNIRKPGPEPSPAMRQQKNEYGDVQLRLEAADLIVLVADAEVARFNLIEALPSRERQAARHGQGPAIIREITHGSHRIKLIVNELNVGRADNSETLLNVSGLLLFSPYAPAVSATPPAVDGSTRR